MTTATSVQTSHAALAAAQVEARRLQRERAVLKERHDSALLGGDAGAVISARRTIEEVDAQLDVLRITEARAQVAVCEADLDALTGQVEVSLASVHEVDMGLEAAREAFEAAATRAQSARGVAMGIDNRIAALRFTLGQRKQTLDQITAEATQRLGVSA